MGLLKIPKPLPTKIPNKKHHIYYWNHLGIGWFTSIRSFLYSIQATITIRDLWVPPRVRKHDVVIIDAFSNEILTERDIALVNSVRLWTRVLTLADICDPS